VVDLLLGLLEAVALAIAVVVVCAATFVFGPRVLSLLLAGVAEAIYWVSRLGRGRAKPSPSSSAAGATEGSPDGWPRI
jgi:hypothetical protein